MTADPRDPLVSKETERLLSQSLSRMALNRVRILI